MNCGNVACPDWSGVGLGLKEQRWARNYFWGLPDLRFFNVDANLLACRWSKAENWVLEAAADLCGHGKHGVGLIALSRLPVGTASRTKSHAGTRLRPTEATHLSHRACYRRRGALWSLTAASYPFSSARRQLGRQPPTSRQHFFLCRSSNLYRTVSRQKFFPLHLI